MKIKYEYVKSMRLAGHLMQQGFRILKITQNARFQDKDVYVFEQSEELSNCILEYIRTKEKKMGIISKTVTVNPRGKMINYYKSKGYDAKYGQELEVKVEDLSLSSAALVETTCDYCGKLRPSIKYVDYNVQTKNGTTKCCCVDCAHFKREETMVERYGAKCALQVPEFKEKFLETNQERYGGNSPSVNAEVREKQKATLIEHYGVDNPSLSKEIQAKREQTFIDRFGVKSSLLSQEVQRKVKQTNLERYGVENVLLNKEIKDKRNSILIKRYGTLYPLQNEECFKKMKQTNLERYGYEYIPQLEETKEKVKQTNLERYGYEYFLQSPENLEKWFAKNGSEFVKSSNQQRYLCNLYNGILNHPFKCFAFDIFLQEDNLDIEYDGSGHRMSISLGSLTEDEFEMKEIYRNTAIKKAGFKQMRIISTKDLLPSTTILLQMLNMTREYFSDYPEHSWIEFNIDTSSVRNAEHKDGVFFNYGELRKINNVA